MRMIRRTSKRSDGVIADKRQRGLSLVELMIAGAILTVGLLSLTGLASVAIMSNSRNRLDGLSYMLSQQVLETVHYTLNSDGSVTGESNLVKDCADNEFTIKSEVGGAALTGGRIDYSQSTVPNGFRMPNYSVCPNPTTSSIITFDVRWNVQQVPNTVNMYLVTVGARPVSWNQNARMFALPANISSIVTAGVR